MPAPNIGIRLANGRSTQEMVRHASALSLSVAIRQSVALVFSIGAGHVSDCLIVSMTLSGGYGRNKPLLLQKAHGSS
jgi:hypothetical protein